MLVSVKGEYRTETGVQLPSNIPAECSPIIWTKNGFFLLFQDFDGDDYCEILTELKVQKKDKIGGIFLEQVRQGGLKF